jgi:hypothetical protein
MASEYAMHRPKLLMSYTGTYHVGSRTKDIVKNPERWPREKELRKEAERFLR